MSINIFVLILCEKYMIWRMLMVKIYLRQLQIPFINQYWFPAYEMEKFLNIYRSKNSEF